MTPGLVKLLQVQCEYLALSAICLYAPAPWPTTRRTATDGVHGITIFAAQGSRAAGLRKPGGLAAVTRSPGRVRLLWECERASHQRARRGSPVVGRRGAPCRARRGRLGHRP